MKVQNRKMFIHFILIIEIVSFGFGYLNIDKSDHIFRHQHHYNQRIEQVVNEFKMSQTHRNRTYIKSENDHGEKNKGGNFVAHEKNQLRHYSHQNHPTWEQPVLSSTNSQLLILPKKSSFTSTSHDQKNLSNVIYGRLFDRDGLHSTNKLKISSPTQSYKTKEFLVFDQERSLTNQREEVNEFHEDYTDRDYADSEVVFKSETNSFNKNDQDENLEDYYDDDYENILDSVEVKTSNHRADTYNSKVYERSLPKRRIPYYESKDAFATSYIPGILTKHKYETLGTHDAVKQSRKSHITNHHHHRDLAKNHVKKIDMEAKCKWPKPKIEKIQKESSKIYVPHCTILHRCADDTGCCNSDRQTCVAKRSEDIHLYFFVKSLRSEHGTVERHTFINHTECECVDRSKHFSVLHTPSEVLRKAMHMDCTCPRLFETVLQGDGCRCDCSSGNSGCDSLKRGMEHFSLTDRKCINEGRCKLPTCEYGNYIRKVGQCPRKEDKMAFSRSYH